MKLYAAIVLILLAFALPASASVVTSLPGGTAVPMPAVNYFGGDPQTFGGVTWSSTNTSTQDGSTFGYNGGYGFGENGFWSEALGPMAGVNDSFDAYGVSDTMTFTFATPVSGVGGFLNYVPGGSTPTIIQALDSLGNVIESYNLTFLTGGANDTGAFYGFLEGSPIIKSFTLTDNYVGITNLTVLGTSSIPEPGNLALIGSGIALLGGLLRRKLGR